MDVQNQTENIIMRCKNILENKLKKKKYINYIFFTKKKKNKFIPKINI